MTVMSPTAPLSLLQILEPSGGGSGRHFLDLCRSLSARSHRVVAVYSPSRAERRFVDELHSLNLAAIRAVPMPRAPGPSDLAAWRALRAIARDDGPFDALHAHSSKAGALSRLRLPGRHCPRVYSPHAFRTMDPTLGRAGRLAFGTIERLLGRFLTDKIVCVSEDERAHAAALGIPQKRLLTVVNGVEPPPVGHGDALRAKLGIPNDALLFGFVGRLSHQKAPHRLLDAFEQVATRNPDAYLWIVGSGELGPEIEARISASTHAGRIHLNGDIPGAMAMDAFDILVMPSRYEAMSYVMLEAAAAGKPMILSDVGGASSVLESGVNGLLIANSDDPAELATAMTRSGDPAVRHAFQAQADARKDRYALDTMVDGLEALYREFRHAAEPRKGLTSMSSALANGR